MVSVKEQNKQILEEIKFLKSSISSVAETNNTPNIPSDIPATLPVGSNVELLEIEDYLKDTKNASSLVILNWINIIQYT